MFLFRRMAMDVGLGFWWVWRPFLLSIALLGDGILFCVLVLSILVL
jgi:hypothetical protein